MEHVILQIITVIGVLGFVIEYRCNEKYMAFLFSPFFCNHMLHQIARKDFFFNLTNKEIFICKIPLTV